MPAGNPEGYLNSSFGAVPGNTGGGMDPRYLQALEAAMFPGASTTALQSEQALAEELAAQGQAGQRRKQQVIEALLGMRAGIPDTPRRQPEPEDDGGGILDNLLRGGAQAAEAKRRLEDALTSGG